MSQILYTHTRFFKTIILHDPKFKSVKTQTDVVFFLQLHDSSTFLFDVFVEAIMGPDGVYFYINWGYL